MTILLRWLVDYAWIFYVGCILGAIFYTVRALIAHRDRGLALFTLERETATSRVVRAWAMVLMFVFIGAAIFISANFILPDLYDEMSIGTPTGDGITKTSHFARPLQCSLVGYFRIA